MPSPEIGEQVDARLDIPSVVAERDSKDRSGPVLVFTADEWEAFTAGVRGGEFDLG